MKSIKYKARAIQIIQIIIMMFGLQMNFLIAANPIDSSHVNPYSLCVTCINSASSTQKDILFNELVSLAPTPPAEATFSDEAEYTEINLAPTAPAEASFDDDPEFISTSVPEFLAPLTLPEADFND